MANLDDISVSAVDKDDPQAQIEKVVKQVNEGLRQISNEDKTKVYKDESGTNRVLLGQGADNFYGMKVSQEGVDVYGAADEDLVFNSDHNLFKIISSGYTTVSGSLVSGTNPTTTTVPHSLGYPPTIIAYLQYTNGSHMLPYVSVGLVGTADAGKVNWMIDVHADSTNMYFTFTDSGQSTGGTYTIKYYIIQETAA